MPDERAGRQGDRVAAHSLSGTSRPDAAFDLDKQPG